jgi:hypothetical protein
MYCGSVCRQATGPSSAKSFILQLRSCPFTGLEDDIDDKLQVYPNPAQTFVHVERLIPIQELIMIATDGKQYLIEPIIDSDKASMDVSHLPSGTYFLCIKTKEGVTWKKIAVMR